MTRYAPLSLYIHIPFCSLKCSYCDFNSYAKLEHLVPDFTRALCEEMRLWSPAMAGRPVPTVFFGGGTPSLLPLARTGVDLRGDARELRARRRTPRSRWRRTPARSTSTTCAGCVALGVEPAQLRRAVVPRRRAARARPHPHGGGGEAGLRLGARGRLPAHQPRPDLRAAGTAAGALAGRRWSRRSSWRRSTSRCTR